MNLGMPPRLIAQSVSNLDSMVLKILAQLRRVMKKNCGESQFARAFQIHFTIVDENAFRRPVL